MISTAADFFKQLARQQTPEHLWIGCADCSMPANDTGELCIQHNVANLRHRRTNSLKRLARPKGFEPLTPRFVGWEDF